LLAIQEYLGKGVIKAVVTSASSKVLKISKHHTTREQRKTLADRMKNPDDELKLVFDKQIAD
jgi:type I restriction enzyme R subunit